MVAMKFAAAVLAVSSINLAKAYPKIATDEKGFLPSKNYIQMKDQVAMESSPLNTSQTPTASDKAGRFGFPTYSTDVQQGYGGNGNSVVPGLYGPVKLDIGGLVLGTIVGLGAFFILPKLLHVISGPYGGGYQRSQDEPEVGGLGLTEIASRVSESLESMNLDSTACLQRAVCTSVQATNSVEGIIDSISKNNMVKSVLAGTDWERAIDVGLKKESCGAAFTKCPFSVDSVIRPIVKYMSAA